MSHVAPPTGHCEPIQEALEASNGLVDAICGPMRGLSASACRLLLMLWESDGLTVSDLADQLDAERSHTEGWLDVLERADLVCLATGGGMVWLTAQGRAIPEGLIGSMCSDRFDALQAEIVSLRDLLHRALRAAEHETATRKAA